MSRIQNFWKERERTQSGSRSIDYKEKIRSHKLTLFYRAVLCILLIVAVAAFLLVQCGRRGSICILISVYGIGLLVDIEMGRGGRQAACRPLDCVDSLLDGIEYWRSLVEFALYSGYRIGLLL